MMGRGLGTGFSRSRVLLAGTLLAALGAALWWFGSGARFAPGASTVAPPPVFGPVLAPVSPSVGPRQVLAAYGHLPLVFEQNQGQSDFRVKFLAWGSGYGLFLTAEEAVLSLRTSNLGSRTSAGRNQHSALNTQHPANRTSVIRMRLADANPSPEVIGAEQLPGQSNYIIGNDPSRWHRNVPQFAHVRYRLVYPGIDLVYHGRQGRLEYDFEVAPGADPRQIGLRFRGPDKLQLDAEGGLVLSSRDGAVRFQAPHVYQKIGEEERQVAGRFVLRAENRVGFEVAAYDRTRTLVIDPVLTYSTYLGGSGNEGCSAITGLTTPGCPAIAVDSAGNAYVAGPTSSADFPVGPPFPLPSCPPTPPGPFQCALSGPADIFVAKFNSTGSALLFSTYLGGTGTDTNVGIAVDSGFNVFVAGTTDSPDFPTSGTNAAFQATPKAAGTHVFVSELDSAGATLLYSTYLSGSGTDVASGLALDVKNKAYVTGTTTSTDFPTTTGAFQQCLDHPKVVPPCPNDLTASNFFVSKVDPATSGAASLPYSTYFGGGNPPNGQTRGGGIAVDSNSNAYITGGTNFVHTGTNDNTDFPILNGCQSTLNGPTDAFLAKINPAGATGAQLIYSTYLGGSSDEVGNAIAVDSGANAYVTGSTTSTDFSLTTSTGCPLPSSVVPFQSANAGGTDAFLAKINSPSTGAVSLVYFSYLGGSTGTADIGYSIAVDSLQGARITGSTDSSDFHILNPLPGTAFGGGTDAFVARIDTTATSATASSHFSSFLGGTGADRGTGVAVDASGSTYVAGETTSVNFPSQSPFQSSLSGASDAFVAKLGPTVNLSFSDVSATPNPVGVGNQVSFKYTVTNNGDLTTGVTFSDVLPATGATFISATSTPGNCGAPTGSPSTVTCSLGTLNAGATATVTVILTPTVAGPLGNSGTVSVVGTGFSISASASSNVTDFNIGVAPPTAKVVAGAPASYTITVTPVPTFPDSISLSCSSGLPTATTCAFSTNPIPNANNGPVTSSLTINTTPRPKTTAELRKLGEPLRATWLPVGGLMLLGLGISGKISRQRRLLARLLLGGLLAILAFQVACGASSKAPPSTGGTPAGTYKITVSATSGSASRTTTLELVVQ